MSMRSESQPKNGSAAGSTGPANPAGSTGPAASTGPACPAASARTVATDAGGGTDKNCAVAQCQMCTKLSKKFACKKCIVSGNFGHSSAVDVENNRFYKKQLRLKNTVSCVDVVRNKCASKCSEKRIVALKNADILCNEEHLRVLKLYTEEKKRIVKDSKDTLNMSSLEIDGLKSSIDRCGKRAVEMVKRTKEQFAVSDDKNIEPIALHKIELRKFVENVVKHILTISEVLPIFEDKAPDANYSLSGELAEASNMTYENGQWIDINERRSIQTEPGYRIVAPVLPADGDYSAYNKNVSLMVKNNGVYENFSELNPACTISAGLTYTSQLVNVLSKHLNVILPYRLKLNAFCGDGLNEDKFSKYVNYLNANVVHLCLSQNVDPKLLHPRQTVKNLLLLFDTSVCDLGRSEPPDTDSVLRRQIQEKLELQIYLSNHSDSDPEDDNIPEWEAVPNIEFPEDHSQSSSQSTSSDGTGMVASAASSLAAMWRDWTK